LDGFTALHEMHTAVLITVGSDICESVFSCIVWSHWRSATRGQRLPTASFKHGAHHDPYKRLEIEWFRGYGSRWAKYLFWHFLFYKTNIFRSYRFTMFEENCLKRSNRTSLDSVPFLCFVLRAPACNWNPWGSVNDDGQRVMAVSVESRQGTARRQCRATITHIKDITETLF